MMLPAWLTKSVAIVIAGIVALLLIAGLFAWHEWRAAHTAKVETRLATGQAGAAIASGQDAANTVGNRMDTDAATDTITRENDNAIRNAPGASAPVDPALRDAALRGLCRRAAYRGDARCLQYAHP
jgi:hypothetical protein